MTLFDRLGVWSEQHLGLDADAALNAVVDEFYAAALRDERLARFFVGVDMEKLKGHQFNFMRYAFSEGRAGTYTGRALATAHERLNRELGLNETHFDYVAEDLVSVLNQFAVPEDIIAGVVEVVSPLRELFKAAPG